MSTCRRFEVPRALPRLPVLALSLMAPFIAHIHGDEPVNLVPPARVEKSHSVQAPERKASLAPPGFNYILGTQTIGAKYQFTDKTRLVETAERILELGSNILKICLDKRYADLYALPKREDIQSLTDLATKEPSFKAVFDMPFTYYFLWAYRFGPGRWADGLSAPESEYREIYDLARYLLERYQGSGKTFFIGHWEGDWHLHAGYDRKRDPTPESIQRMIDWLNIRQQGVDDAKRDTAAKRVQMYHYTEVNLVQKALQGGKCLTNDVLPHTRVDYVSYSSYDTVVPHKGNVRESLRKALDYIESKLPSKEGMAGRRVFIGEYGFPVEKETTPEMQDAYSRDVCRTAIEWGCPFVLYWQLYCNEIRDDKHRGFWLIDDKNQKQPFYFTLQDYFTRMKAFIAEFEQMHGRLPTGAEARVHALAILAQPK